MRLITFREGGIARVGLLKEDESIVDLSKVSAGLPRDMLSLIELGSPAIAEISEAESVDSHFGLSEVVLEPVILRPPKIIGIGLNYKAHAEESNMNLPEVPLVFTKQSTSVSGPYSPIYWSEEGKVMDYEGELGIVIGRKCRRVPKESAKDVIFGYTIGNDVSVRDWQVRGTPPSFTMGKSWDSHCPLGPGIVVDPSLDPHELHLQTWVNDELRQDTMTNDLIFDCYELIEFLSTAFTLEPGDVILTGTPSGVGMAQKPPALLKPGDRIRVAIGGLGHIENTVTEEPQEKAKFIK